MARKFNSNTLGDAVTAKLLLRFCGYASLLALLAGCSGLRIHSETRDKQGQAATAAFKAVSLEEFFKKEREQRAKLLELELKASDDLVAADQELTIRRLSSMTADEFRKLIDDRLSELTRSTNLKELQAIISAVETAEQKLTGQRASFTRATSFLSDYGAPQVVCDADLQNNSGPLVNWRPTMLPGDQQAIALLNRNIAVLSCQRIGEHQKTLADNLAKLNGGLIGSTQAALFSVEAQHKTEAKRVKDEAAAFKTAQDDYRKALAAASGPSKKDFAKEQAEKLENVVSNLEKLQNAAGDAFLSQKRIDEISSLIKSWKEGSLPGVDDKNSLVLLKMLPHLSDDIQAIERAEAGASLVPLLILREVEQSRLDAAKLDLTFTARRLELLRSQRAALIDQASTLLAARSNLESAASQFSKEPLKVSWGLKDQAKAQAVVAALRGYLDAIGVQRQKSERLERLRYALEIERSSAMSEINANLWLALIGTSVEQSSTFAQQGLRTSDLTNIITAGGILGIAYGTNK